MSFRGYSKEDLKRIKEMFNFLDKNNQGGITIEDLKLGIIGLGGELTAKEVGELKNQKEIYDLEDFVSICQQKNININELENKLLLAFSLLEVDKKGYVPSSSLVALLKNDKVPDKEIQQLINEAKPDKYNNIEYRNFVKEILDSNSDDDESNKKDNNDNNDSDNDNDNNNNSNEYNNNNDEDNSDY